MKIAAIVIALAFSCSYDKHRYGGCEQDVEPRVRTDAEVRLGSGTVCQLPKRGVVRCIRGGQHFTCIHNLNDLQCAAGEPAAAESDK